MKTSASVPDQSPHLNRREFVRSTVRGVVAAGAMSTFPFVSRARVLEANDRVGVGFIGVGGRGSTHRSDSMRHQLEIWCKLKP